MSGSSPYPPPGQSVVWRRLQVKLITDKSLDRKSKDPFVKGRVKPKYKLAALQFFDLGEYLFFVFTSEPTACMHKYLFSVADAEWEHKAPGLILPASYCDHTRHEWLDQRDLLCKMDDQNNGFPYVARLSAEKYSELQIIIERAHKAPDMSTAVKDIVGKGMLTNINGLASKLGIA